MHFFICFLCSHVYSPVGSWALCTVRERVVVFVHMPSLHSFFTAVHACRQMLGVGSVWGKQRDRLRPEHHLLHLLHFHNADWWRLPELLPGKEKPPPFSDVLFGWKAKKNKQAAASSIPAQCVEFSIIYVSLSVGMTRGFFFSCITLWYTCFFFFFPWFQPPESVFFPPEGKLWQHTSIK